MNKILSILGENHTDTASFKLSSGEYIGVYTYKKGVYVICNEGDIAFEDLPEIDQFEAIEVIESGEYEVRNDMQ